MSLEMVNGMRLKGAVITMIMMMKSEGPPLGLPEGRSQKLKKPPPNLPKGRSQIEKREE